MNGRYLTELAGFVARTKVAEIPPDVVAGGRMVLADCIGCMVAGSHAPEARRLAALASEGGQASLIGTTDTGVPSRAAYVNGIAGTWHDLDEGNLHTRTHAGIEIVPA